LLLKCVIINIEIEYCTIAVVRRNLWRGNARYQCRPLSVVAKRTWASFCQVPLPTTTWIHEASTFSFRRPSPTTLAARNLKQGDLLRTTIELPFGASRSRLTLNRYPYGHLRHGLSSDAEPHNLSGTALLSNRAGLLEYTHRPPSFVA
jgi:hypothetical protein